MTSASASPLLSVRSVQTFYSYCAPRPMQFGAARALNQGDDWLANMRETYGRAGKAAAETRPQQAQTQAGAPLDTRRSSC